MNPAVQRSPAQARARLPLAIAELATRPLPPFVGSRAIVMALRLAGARVAVTTSFWGMPRLVGPAGAASRLEIGSLCGLNFGCYFELDAPIVLADHVAVGHEVLFLTRTHEPKPSGLGVAPSGAQPIRIEAGAWIGSRAVIMPGVTVGAGSVVGASVVVRHDVPPNTLLAGSRRISIAKWR